MVLRQSCQLELKDKIEQMKGVCVWREGGWKCSLFSVLYGDIKSGLQTKILNHGSPGSFILKS